MSVPTPQLDNSPIGEFKTFLNDLKARGFKPQFILDVGANHGSWTFMAKGVFPEASFLMIEPQEEMRASLDNLCRNLPDVSWVEAGAGAEPGKLVLTVWEDLAGSSFVPDVNDQPLEGKTQREVPIVTIDNLLESRGLKTPDFVKLDIQGFELEALKGASTLFGVTELFVLEVSLFPFFPNIPIFREVVEFMGERGYEVYDIPGYLRRPMDGALGQLDVAFAKRDGILRQSSGW